MKKTKVRAPTNVKGKTITTGEIFSGGTMIELVQAPQGSNKPHLLLWKGTGATIATQVEYRDHIYEAPELTANFYRATRFPARCNNYQSLRELFNEIATVFDQYLQLSERGSRLLTSFVIGTWLADHLPISPNLVISGPDQRLGIELLKLLSCLCRRPLLLTELTPGGFQSLPMQLSLTLLINQQSLRPSMLRLFHASSYRGLHLTGGRGVLIDIYGPKAIFAEAILSTSCLGNARFGSRSCNLGGDWRSWMMPHKQRFLTSSNRSYFLSD